MKKKKESDKLIKLIQGNIEQDRARLSDLYDSIMKAIKPQKEVTDPFALISASENLVKIADSLTKQNSQLVDVAKLKAKNEEARAPKLSPGDFDEDEKQGLYDFIENNGHEEEIIN